MRRSEPPPVRLAASTVRTILTREIYSGTVVWNKCRASAQAWGKVDQQPHPESEWLRAERPNLRIVDPQLWARVAARRKDVEGTSVRFASGRISGRPPEGASQNLLAGLATCGLCGGGLQVECSGRRAGRVQQYLCYRYRHTGTCSNRLRVDVAAVTEAVLHAIEEHALTPEAIEQVVALHEREDVQDRQAALTSRRTLRGASRGWSPPLKRPGTQPVWWPSSPARGPAGCHSRRMRRTATGAPLQAEVVVDRLADWRRLLRGSMPQARAVLQRVLQGRITFTPAGTGYTFEAATRLNGCLQVSRHRARRLCRRPTRQRTLVRRDTFDGDYGRLLERAASRGKGVTSPRGT